MTRCTILHYKKKSVMLEVRALTSWKTLQNALFLIRAQLVLFMHSSSQYIVHCTVHSTQQQVSTNVHSASIVSL